MLSLPTLVHYALTASMWIDIDMYEQRVDGVSLLVLPGLGHLVGWCVVVMVMAVL